VVAAAAAALTAAETPSPALLVLNKEQATLSIVDPAFKPVQPTGPGKTIFLMAGMVLFVALGLSFAVGLAMIDDRLYRRIDLDQLGVAVLAVIPAATARKPTPKRKPTQRARAQTKGGAP